MTANGISGVVIAKNEIHVIEKCLKSLQLVCDEIIVIDSHSTDGTAELAEQLGAKVFKEHWIGYAATKNLGNSRSAFNFILSVDADEVLSGQLIDAILKIKSSLNGVYAFNRLNFYAGVPVKYCGWYPDKKIRLFPKNSVYWKGDYVHETLVIPENIKITHLKGDLLHFTVQSAAAHKKTVEKYAGLAAKELAEKGKLPSFLKPYLSFITMFLKKYLLQLGFTGGLTGLNISYYSALSRFLRYKTARELMLNSK